MASTTSQPDAFSTKTTQQGTPEQAASIGVRSWAPPASASTSIRPSSSRKVGDACAACCGDWATITRVVPSRFNSQDRHHIVAMQAELVWAVAGAAADARPFHGLGDAFGVFARGQLAILQRHRDVFGHTQVVDQCPFRSASAKAHITSCACVAATPHWPLSPPASRRWPHPWTTASGPAQSAEELVPATAGTAEVLPRQPGRPAGARCPAAADRARHRPWPSSGVERVTSVVL